jgi:TonB-linked SusC/RagA family outer membrane protein
MILRLNANSATDKKGLWNQIKLSMKLTTILVLAATLQISAKGISQKVSISVKNATIEEVFEQLQQKTGYHFIFNSAMLAKAKRVNVEVKDKTVEKVLGLCFEDQPFTYIIKDKVIIVKEKEIERTNPVKESIPEVSPPSQILKGVVKDANNNPIDGASVFIKEINAGTSTNKEGKFQLQVPAGTHELEISFVGFKTVKLSVTIGDTPPADVAITLTPEVTGLTDVLVVGYGTQKKRDVTGTVSSVKGDDFKNTPVSNAATLLEGRASGVNIVSGDGGPGSLPSIRIRGTGTINNADPLVVIDGVPAGGLNDVNPNDIASIEILKDASSSAIYGSRAANGVVLVTTKKGNFNEKIKTTVNYYTGVNKTLKYLNMLTAPDLAQLKQEAFTNDSLPVPSVWTDPYYSTQRTDWQHQVLTTGHVQNVDVAVRGGNANSSYSFSGNYYYEKGIIINSYFKRYNFRINSEHKIGSRIRVGENVLFSNTSANAPDTRSTQTGLLWSTIRFNPAIPVVNPDGTWGTSQADNQLGDINNPVTTVYTNPGSNSSNQLLINGFAELEIIKDLKIRANYGFNQGVGDGLGFSEATPSQTRGPSISSLGQNFSKSKSLLEEYFITYNKKFNNVHDVNLTAGYSSQVFSGYGFSASRSGYSDTSADQRILNLGSSSSAGNAGSNAPTSGLQSYFVRSNYAYQGKYLLTLTMRADGSSKFAPGKRWGYFPAFSAGWRISDEKFFKRFKAINSLKITGGWGQLGNQNIGDFQYLGIIGLGAGGGLGGGGYSYNFGTNTVNQNGAFVTSLANPNITWEKAVMTNISLEFATLNNHLTGVVTYFNKNTSDMLVLAQLVETYGAQVALPDDPGNISLPNVNQGKLNNHGVEVELNYKNRAGKFGYSIGGNGAFLSNKVTKLYGNATYLGSTPYGRENVDISRTYEGQPIASFYGFKTNGLYQTQSDVDKDPNIANDPNKANIRPGDVRFVDINGDGVVDDKDRVRLGDPNPHFVYGITGSVSYGHFDFNINFAGVAGVKLYNADRLAGLDATQNFNWYADEKNRWHGAGTSNSIPRLTRSNLNNNYRSSDLWVQNGSFLALKNISLGYTVTKRKLGDFDIPDIRIYISSYNLFYITKYSGYTPELGYTKGNLQRGVDVAQYPQARNFTVGASLNF